MLNPVHNEGNGQGLKGLRDWSWMSSIGEFWAREDLGNLGWYLLSAALGFRVSIRGSIIGARRTSIGFRGTAALRSSSDPAFGL